MCTGWFEFGGSSGETRDLERGTREDKSSLGGWKCGFAIGNGAIERRDAANARENTTSGKVNTNYTVMIYDNVWICIILLIYLYFIKRYVELLKSEKSLVASPRLTDKDREILDRGSKRTITELERTIFSLKKIVEKLQAENKRLKLSKTKYCHRFAGASVSIYMMHIIQQM